MKTSTTPHSIRLHQPNDTHLQNCRLPSHNNKHNWRGACSTPSTYTSLACWKCIGSVAQRKPAGSGASAPANANTATSTSGNINIPAAKKNSNHCQTPVKHPSKTQITKHVRTQPGENPSRVFSEFLHLLNCLTNKSNSPARTGRRSSSRRPTRQRF